MLRAALILLCGVSFVSLIGCNSDPEPTAMSAADRVGPPAANAFNTSSGASANEFQADEGGEGEGESGEGDGDWAEGEGGEGEGEGDGEGDDFEGEGEGDGGEGDGDWGEGDGDGGEGEGDGEGGEGDAFEGEGGPGEGEGDWAEGEGGEGDAFEGEGGDGGGRRAEGPGTAFSVAPSRQPTAEGHVGQYEQAFFEGREKDAFQILYAMALADESTDLLEKIHWVSGLRRPALGVRFGIGIDLARDYEGNAYPIGSDQNIPESRRQRPGQGGGDFDGDDFDGDSGEGDPSGFPGGRGGGGGRDDLLTRYTGELGDQFVERFENSVGNGHFGEVLLAACELVGVRRASGGAGSGDGFEGYADGEGDGDADGTGEAFAGGGAARGQKPEAPNGQPAALMAGLTMLGKGSLRELLRKAENEGIDVLAVFDVSIKRNTRTGLVTNDTRMSLLDVRRGTPDGMLQTAKTLNNVKVQIERRDAREGRGSDSVELAFEKLFGYVDAEEGLKTSALPEGIKPEHVLARVQEIVKSKPDNPLPALVEIKFYHSRELLTLDHMTMAFKELIGDEKGAQLVEGNQAERFAAIQTWIP